MAIALIVAAGRGERLGTSGPKAFVSVAGRPMIAWSIDAFRASGSVREIVVALPPGWEPSESEAAELDGCIRCEGGKDRSLSVRAALEAASAGEADEPVLVHDAARALVEPHLIEELVLAVAPGSGCQAAIAACPVTDTIKVADEGGFVLSTPERSTLKSVQTPQAFSRNVLKRALAQDDGVLSAATDDAALVAQLGIKVLLVDAPTENFKVTEPKDLELANLILSRRTAGGSI